MKCKIIIGSNGNTVDLDIDSLSNLPLTDEEILRAINDNLDQKGALIELLENASYNRFSFKPVKAEQLITKEGILPNTNLSYLKELFPDVIFPDNVEANILLVHNLNVIGLNMYGRVINSSGMEVIVVSDSNDDIKALANFLDLKLKLKDGVLFDENSEDYKLLKKCYDSFKAKEKLLQELRKSKAEVEANDKISRILSDQSRSDASKKSSIRRIKGRLNEEKANIEKSEIKTLGDLLLNFLYSKSDYYSLTIGTGTEAESVFSILDKICRKLLGKSDRKQFRSLLINEINASKIYSDNGSLITYELLYESINTFRKDICEKLKINNLDEFIQFFSKLDFNSELSKIFDYSGDVLRLEVLVNGLFDEEPEFHWEFDKVAKSGKSFYIKQTSRTLSEKYNYSYDTIYLKTIIDEDYFGYKIYKYQENGLDKYIAHRGYISQYSTESVFDSEKEIKEYIENKVKQQSILANSFKDFKELSSFVIKGTYLNMATHSVIESIDIPIDYSINIQNMNEYNFLNSSGLTLLNFLQIVRSWNIGNDLKNDIINRINTPEKAYLFIHLMNLRFGNARTESEIETVGNSTTNDADEKFSGNELIRNLINNIIGAPKKLYFIDTKTSLGNGRYDYRVIPVNEVVTVENYKELLKNERQPIVEFMSALSKVLSENFGLKINMLTSQEIAKKFKGKIDANKTKAFVRNGQIYINTTIAEVTDPIHEFTHLILGIIKANPKIRENYDALMYVVSLDAQGQREINRLREIYPDISEMDLREEAFVSLFSLYVISSITDPNSIFENAAEEKMKSFGENIFNIKITSVKNFYRLSLDTVFRRFSGLISQLLNSKDKVDFKPTGKLRKVSNWISENIKSGNIKEDCK